MILVPYLQKELGATIVVENMPGGTGTQTINLTYQAKPDGLTLYLGDPTAIAFGDWMKEPGVLWDTSKLNYIGELAREPTIFCGSPKSTFKSIQDLQQTKGLKIGAASPNTFYGVGHVAVVYILNLDAKVIAGFKGSADLILSVAKSELDGITLVETQAQTNSKSGQMRPIFVYWGESVAFSNLPNLAKEVKLNSEQKMMYDAVGTISKAVVTGPGVPQDRVDYLRKTLSKICDDKNTQQDIMKKVGYATWYGFTPGEELQKRIGQQGLGAQVKALLDAANAKYLVR